MASCKCRELEECRKLLDTIRRAEERRLEQDITTTEMGRYFEDELMYRGKSFESQHQNCLNAQNERLKSMPRHIYKSIGCKIASKREEIEAERNRLQTEDEQFHEEERRKAEESNAAVM